MSTDEDSQFQFFISDEDVLVIIDEDSQFVAGKARLRVPSARDGAMGDDSRNRALAFDRLPPAIRAVHRTYTELTVVRESQFWRVTTAVAPPLEVLVSAQINVFGSTRRA